MTLAREGPVPLVIRGDFTGLDAAERDRLVSTAFARGVRGLTVTFEPVAAEAAARERLVVALNPSTRAPANRLCTSRSSGSTATAGEERIAAAFCRNDQALGAVSGAIEGTGTRERERLIWRTADALFPDDYEDTYGLGGLLPDRGGGGGGSGGY